MNKLNMIAILLSLVVSAAAQSEGKRLKKLRIDFPAEATIHAGSRIVDQDALDGFASSKVLPTPVKGALSKLRLFVNTDVPTAFGKYRGVRLFLQNGTGKQVRFPAQDSRLFLVQEAQDIKGNWRQIETLTSSWCGNSYHDVILGAGLGWEFKAVKYYGPFRTKLRFRVQYEDSGKTRMLYSNEFIGSIDKKQFTKSGVRPIQFTVREPMPAEVSPTLPLGQP